MSMKLDWDTYFLEMASLVAKKSKDPSTKVGAVIVGPEHEVRSTGYNGFPRGIDEYPNSRWERPEKYSWCEHAERNAIYNAAMMGTALKGCTAYIQCTPCTPCGRALIQAGIKEVVISKDNPFSERSDWKDDTDFCIDMLKEAGVAIRWIDLHLA
jgi:dCMP deaminase